MGVHTVADMADFDSQLEKAGDKLVVVDFFATWCGPCRLIAPKVQEFSVSDDFKDSVVFLKVDVDDIEELATKYNVRCMPTFLFFKNKSKIEEFSGANEDKLKELIINKK